MCWQRFVWNGIVPFYRFFTSQQSFGLLPQGKLWRAAGLLATVCGVLCVDQADRHF